MRCNWPISACLSPTISRKEANSSSTPLPQTSRNARFGEPFARNQSFQFAWGMSAVSACCLSTVTMSATPSDFTGRTWQRERIVGNKPRGEWARTKKGFAPAVLQAFSSNALAALLFMSSAGSTMTVRQALAPLAVCRKGAVLRTSSTEIRVRNFFVL